MAPKSTTTIPRSPVVAVVGHIDHGKSTLLDYIRKTNTVAQEKGGITQHLSAYEAVHENASGAHTITFLDTPGHAAFSAMRERGLSAADVAILVVSAEEGVKPQTLEALELIKGANIPYIVALTKADKETANIERAKASLLERGVYLEGLGGEIPYVAVSGKTGAGISELLDLILLAAELQGITTDPDAPAAGTVIEAHIESKRGASATLIVKNGVLRSGEFVIAGAAYAPVRIMENFLGKGVREAGAGSPVRIVGFSALPAVGGAFSVVKSKKEAESIAQEVAQRERLMRIPKAVPSAPPSEEIIEAPKIIVLPLLIKTDVAGTGDAVTSEIKKIPAIPRLELDIVGKNVGSISEADIKVAGSSEHPGIVVGFNVKIDPAAQTLAERLGVSLQTFDIIYKLTEWLSQEIEKRRPRERIEEKTGTARILKIFSQTKRSYVLGGRVEEGSLRLGEEVRIIRRDLELGRGSLESLQSQKESMKAVEAGNEFGAIVKTDAPVAPNDRLEAFAIVYK